MFIENERQTEDAINYLRSAEMKLVRRSASHRTGFIAQPFEKSFNYIGDKIEEGFRRHKVQATAYRPTPGEPFVAPEMLSQINSAHFGIADITSLNQNVLIEAGVMIGINKPLVIIRRRGDRTPIPFDVAGKQVFQYEQEGEDIFIYDAQDKK